MTRADPDDEAVDGGRRRRRGGALLELPVLLLVAFGLALLLRTFVVAAFYIPSESMVPTLQVGDRVLVNKLVYDLRDPRRGEVIVFRADTGFGLPQDEPTLLDRVVEFLSFGLNPGTSEEDFIKRVIALPGETVELRDGVVLIDGEPLAESLASEGGYLQDVDLDPFGPLTVPEGEYFVLGDWRTNSGDSRFQLGTIPREDITGRAFVLLWPPGRFRLLSGAEYELSATPASAAAPVERRGSVPAST